MDNIHESIKADYGQFISVKKICEKYNINRTFVQRSLIKQNIKLRKNSSPIKMNHFFFSQYNTISCYWAGFILADGYIRTGKRFNLQIKLQKRDKEHLEKFKTSLNYEGKILEYKDYVNISISSKQIIEDLANKFEILNKKSLTCFISEKIPKVFLKDFIRGYFDGDGCISFSTMDTISFLGTYKTVDKIRNFIFETTNITMKSKNLPSILTNGNIYTINYNGIRAFQVLKYLYEKSNNYLDRKYNLYTNLKNKYTCPKQQKLN